jgi:hypothetical protein
MDLWILAFQTFTFDSQTSELQTTDVNLGQAHCLASQAPTLDLWLEITKSRKFVMQGFI